MTSDLASSYSFTKQSYTKQYYSQSRLKFEPELSVYYNKSN